MLLLASPAFAQMGGDRVSSFLSNTLSYAQGLGIFGAGFLVIWAVRNLAREPPSGKQWAGAGGALLLSSVLQLLRTFAGWPMTLRLRPVARSLSVRAEFIGLEWEDWGFVIAWAIVMRLIGDHIHRVFLSLIPVSTVMTYGSAAVVIWVSPWGNKWEPRG